MPANDDHHRADRSRPICQDAAAFSAAQSRRKEPAMKPETQKHLTATTRAMKSAETYLQQTEKDR